MRSTQIIGRDGLRGEMTGPVPSDPRTRVTVRLENGEVLEIPASLLNRRQDGSCEIPLGSKDIAQPWEESTEQRVTRLDEAVVPVLAEELVVDTRAVPVGGVRVHRRVLEHEEEIELPLMREHLDIRRVILNQDVGGPLPVRQDGDTIIVPIVEEVLVVEKRFRLKEEVHMTRRAFEEMHRERVVVRRQEAEIERIVPDDTGPVTDDASARTTR